MTEIYTYNSAPLNCPYCGKMCDSYFGIDPEVVDDSIGICSGCTQIFWLCIESLEPMTLSVRKVTDEEYAAFNPTELETIESYRNFLGGRMAAMKEIKKHAAFLRIMAQITEEFDIDLANVLLMFAYYPLSAVDLATDSVDREYASALFARYSELCKGVIEDEIEYAYSVFSVVAHLRDAADFVSKN